jgi:hypothetical protein
MLERCNTLQDIQQNEASFDLFLCRQILQTYSGRDDLFWQAGNISVPDTAQRAAAISAAAG